jgi:hypothetical protein
MVNEGFIDDLVWPKKQADIGVDTKYSPFLKAFKNKEFLFKKET